MAEPTPETPPASLPVGRAAAALALALLVALSLNPRVPGGWARDAGLPEATTLAAIDAADALAAWAEAAGLTAPGDWVSARVQALREE
ncbi:hypothetical protein [Rubrimonas cliftonensis]|uniref:Uncharacterized protein n=1 Tax=Rubrimonas cliftonensis TaxID=89524 RepID=A0A1H3YRC4_9RHOB|nr:hypothetical protein [Rubrimonas cliftonensis]SEA13761.1 hypothetical protein SAMN05444370_103203 [Rubrimonas cliftonensis]